MTPTQFRAALDRLSLTQGEAATLLGVSLRTTHGYANGEPIPRSISLCLQMLLQLGDKARKALMAELMPAASPIEPPERDVIQAGRPPPSE